MAYRKQGSISTFFQSGSPPRTSGKKRPSETIDLTGESTPPPPTKRSKGTSTSKNESPYFSRGPASSSRATPSQSQTGILEQYGYAAEKPTVGPQARSSAQQKRHEAFKKRLLLDGASVLPNGASTGNETPERGHGAIQEALSEATDSDSDQDVDKNDAFERLQALVSESGKKASRRKGNTTTLPAKAPRKASEIGPSGKTYTPLELQVRDLKEQNPGSFLMVEVGYKYKFFGEDAKIAAKELGMIAYQDRNYVVASIPTHRRDAYLKKLLSQGYRVGIVNQIETAALKKVSDNKSGPFERKLTHLYTDTTYVDEINSVDDLERYNPPPVMCIVEEWKTEHNSTFGIVTICPTTGDVIWDDFDDKVMRIELETRLSHLQPAEILQPQQGLSETTARMLSSFSGTSTTGNKIRHEYFQKTMDYTDAFEFVSAFYTDKSKSDVSSETFRSGQLMAEITNFPKRVVVALAHAIKHLSAFGVADAFLETRFFTKFATAAHMLLAANTLTNLEIYRNETDGSTDGSLIWILDRTKTKFGARLLRNWVGRPLVDKMARILQERVASVKEIVDSPSERLLTLRQLLKGLPDLAKGLSRIQCRQCTPPELAIILPAFHKIGQAFASEEFQESKEVGLESSVLNDIIFALPKLKDPVQQLLSEIHLTKATEGRKEDLWTDFDKYPDIADAALALQIVHVELKQELKAARKVLGYYSLDWTTWGQEEYLIQVQKKDKRPIPDNWVIVSSTRTLARYRTPGVITKLQEKAQYQERLQAAANAAFDSFLVEISAKCYGILRDAVNRLAVADCLFSLAHVALREGYVCPQFVDEDVMEIIGGRHPMIEELRSTPYIHNSVCMGRDKPRSKIITGPNMGGKSSCVRTIALITIMAQIGSYVPATSVKMKLIDSVLTRMGASDDITRGKSTFMVEMTETREILEAATSSSLVILDELGRGTSTFDGMAIADAVLHYLVQNKNCKTLFITHYPMVATRLQKRFPADLENLHMEYRTDSQIDGTRKMTFLYNLTSGLAPESFGIECGRLAGLPEKLLQIASQRSDQLFWEVNERIERNRIRKALRLMRQMPMDKDTEGDGKLDELVALARAVTLSSDNLPQ